MRCAGLPRSAPTVPGKAGSAGLPPGRRGPSLAAWAPTEWSPGSKRLDAPLAFAWPASPAPGTSAPSAARRPRGPRFHSCHTAPGAGKDGWQEVCVLGSGIWGTAGGLPRPWAPRRGGCGRSGPRAGNGRAQQSRPLGRGPAPPGASEAALAGRGRGRDSSR